MKRYWFRCPSCRELYTIDEDQAQGRVSILCPGTLCGFSIAGRVSPLMPAEEPQGVHTRRFRVEPATGER